MRAAIFNGPRDIVVGDRPDPAITTPTDAVVRVTLGCVCGSDLWYYRGDSPHSLGPIGHEFMGIVEAVGSAITTLAAGDLVVAPFTYSDGTCVICRDGVTSQCLAGGSFGNRDMDGGQGEAVRVPFADATLVKVPGSGHSDAVLRSVLALSDVMCTGHHAAVSAGVRPGSVAAVVGDGAVGLCGGARRPSVGGRADHRPVSQPGPPGARPRVRRDRHRRRAGRRGNGGGPRPYRRPGHRRHARVRRHRRVDGDRLRHRAPRLHGG